MSSLLISGGTGFLGNALVRFAMKYNLYSRIVVFSRDEHKHAKMREALKFDPRLRFFLGDVRDRDRLRRAMSGVQDVIHAAALKRVDDGAYNPGEVKKTNVDGTENVCLAAIDAGVKRVVMISTDKAVRPMNIYGSSKMFGENLTIFANAEGVPKGTRLGVIRYGNVVGSTGSVLEIWKRQAERGELLTITHEEMTRFWITREMACQAVFAVLPRLKGGEVFVPKLKAYRVADMAAAMFPEDASVCQNTFRPGGEKLHEELLNEEEMGRCLEAADYYLVQPSPCSWFEPSKVWQGMPPERFEYRSDKFVEPVNRTMIEEAIA